MPEPLCKACGISVRLSDAEVRRIIAEYFGEQKVELASDEETARRLALCGSALTCVTARPAPPLWLPGTGTCAAGREAVPRSACPMVGEPSATGPIVMTEGRPCVH